jgi:hypothetical protein
MQRHKILGEVAGAPEIRMTQTVVKSNRALVRLSCFEGDKKYAGLFLTQINELKAISGIRNGHSIGSEN